MEICDIGNGIELRMDGVGYRFDPRRVIGGDVNIVSHAHSDHLPTRTRDGKVACTELTYDLARVGRRRLDRGELDGVALRDAGHVPGSAMAVVEGERKVIYTGDFCSRRKNHLEPAAPEKCDVLITESTYGRPGYDFPDHEEAISSVRAWVEETLRAGSAALLLTYPIGKAQELCFELRDMDILLQPTIAGNNGVVASHGLDIASVARGDRLPEPPFIYLTSGMGRERELVEKLVAGGAKTAMFSGWAMDCRFAPSRRPARDMFPISDHCGYTELLEFVRRCDPEVVFTTHGFTDELARGIRRELGIEAHPRRDDA